MLFIKDRSTGVARPFVDNGKPIPQHTMRKLREVLVPQSTKGVQPFMLGVRVRLQRRGHAPGDVYA